jgi:hypothetical protein
MYTSVYSCCQVVLRCSNCGMLFVDTLDGCCAQFVLVLLRAVLCNSQETTKQQQTSKHQHNKPRAQSDHSCALSSVMYGTVLYGLI